MTSPGPRMNILYIKSASLQVYSRFLESFHRLEGVSEADRTFTQQVRTRSPGGAGSSVHAGRPLLDNPQEQ